jgi:hypothetical protein
MSSAATGARLRAGIIWERRDLLVGTMSFWIAVAEPKDIPKFEALEA